MELRHLKNNDFLTLSGATGASCLAFSKKRAPPQAVSAFAFTMKRAFTLYSSLYTAELRLSSETQRLSDKNLSLGSNNGLSRRTAFFTF
jgi:hypothetical protein